MSSNIFIRWMVFVCYLHFIKLVNTSVTSAHHPVRFHKTWQIHRGWRWLDAVHQEKTLRRRLAAVNNSRHVSLIKVSTNPAGQFSRISNRFFASFQLYWTIYNLAYPRDLPISCSLIIGQAANHWDHSNPVYQVIKPTRRKNKYRPVLTKFQEISSISRSCRHPANSFTEHYLQQTSQYISLTACSRQVQPTA